MENDWTAKLHFTRFGYMSSYERPAKRIHRGFFYLDDESLINSLSTFEAGKVDEVVAKAVTAREGGGSLGVGLGVGAASIKGDIGKKGSESLEEEMVRTRTRFSIFQAWLDHLVNAKAIGHFNGWGTGALVDVQPGDTVELKAALEVVPLQGLFRLFEWFTARASEQGNAFSQKGEELKSTKEAFRNMKVLMGDPERPEFVLLATPEGDAGPVVAMKLEDRWTVGNIGRLSGIYTVVAQVDEILNEGDRLPIMRLTRDAPATPMELDLLIEVVGNFVDAAEGMGVTVTKNDGVLVGPAIWLNPVAIFR